MTVSGGYRRPLQSGHGPDAPSNFAVFHWNRICPLQFSRSCLWGGGDESGRATHREA